MGMIRFRDRFMLQQLVEDCVMFGLDEKESLTYIETRSGGLKISRSNFYHIKQRLNKEKKIDYEERLNEHCRTGYVLQHLRALDGVCHKKFF
jgi:hypothetical protein